MAEIGANRLGEGLGKPGHGRRIHPAQGLRPGERHRIAAVALAHVEAVSGDGIPHGGGAEMADGHARRNNPRVSPRGQDLCFHGVQNGGIHGVPITAVAGKARVGTVPLVRPGHVPVQSGLGIALVAADELQNLPLAGVGFGEPAVVAGLLQGDDIPCLVGQSLGQRGLRSSVPNAVGILHVHVGRRPLADVLRVELQRAPAYVEIPQNHLLHTAVPQDIPQVGHGILRKAIANRQNPNRSSHSAPPTRIASLSSLLLRIYKHKSTPTMVKLST